MPHSLICGMSLSGKSALGKIMAHKWRAAGFRVAVLDPMQSPEWPADYMTRDAERFLLFCKSNRNFALFVDEGAAALEQAADYNWLTSRARHWGHESHILSQRPQDISTGIRGNCEHVFCFNIDPLATKMLARDWNAPDLIHASKNQCCVFHQARRMSDEGVRVAKLDFAKKTWTYLKPWSVDEIADQRASHAGDSVRAGRRRGAGRAGRL